MTGPSDKDKLATMRMFALIAMMVIAWSVIILGRNTVRAYWWSHRIEHAPDPAAQTMYFQLLAGLRDDALPGARRLLRSTNPSPRSVGVALLNHMQTEDARALQRAVLDDSDPNIRLSALRGLAARGLQPDDLDPVKRQLDDADEQCAAAAVGALAAAGPRAIESLIEALNARYRPAVRVNAAQLLAMLKADAAVDALIECLDDDSVFVGLTELEKSAGLARLSAASNPAAPPRPAAPVTFPDHRTVSRAAAEALEIITGQTFGYDDDDESAKQECIRQWRQWRATSN